MAPRQRRPLVLLPGALGNGDAAWRIAQAFDADRRVIRVTLPRRPGPGRAGHRARRAAGTLETGPVALWGLPMARGGRKPSPPASPERVEALWSSNTFVDGADVAPRRSSMPHGSTPHRTKRSSSAGMPPCSAAGRPAARRAAAHAASRIDAHAFHGACGRWHEPVALPPAPLRTRDQRLRGRSDDHAGVFVRAFAPVIPRLAISAWQGGHYPHIVAPDALASPCAVAA